MTMQPPGSACICRMVAETPHAYPTVTWDPACPMHGEHAQTSMQRLAIERWKERGRDLNAIYAVLSPATAEYTTHDPVEDLQNLVGERDQLRAAVAAAYDAAHEFLDDAQTALVTVVEILEHHIKNEVPDA